MVKLPDEDLFDKIKECYYLARKEQWIALRNFFENEGKIDGFKVITNGHAGYGFEKYKSNRKFTDPYDLSNWRWVELRNKDKGITVLVSLQEYDITSSGWIVTLTDRIGIYICQQGKSDKEVYNQIYGYSKDMDKSIEKIINEYIGEQIQKGQLELQVNDDCYIEDVGVAFPLEYVVNKCCENPDIKKYVNDNNFRLNNDELVGKIQGVLNKEIIKVKYDYISNMKDTEIELPLNDEKLNKLYNVINENIKKLNERSKSE